MESNDASYLIINFIGKNKIFDGFNMFGKKYNFNQTKIEIQNEFFVPNKEKKIVEFQLIPKNPKMVYRELNFYLYIYYGINKVYCFLEEKDGLLYDIIFLDDEIVINYEDIELKEINTLTNDSRSRIVLINSPSKFKINNTYTDLNTYIPTSFYKSNKSFQLAFFDYLKDAYSFKPINQENNDEELLIVNILKKNKISLINFLKALEQLINAQEIEEEKFRSLCKAVSLEKNIINFSQKKYILNENFNSEELYYLIYIYMLWLIYDGILSSNDKTNEGNNIIFDDDILDNIKKEKENKDETICNYSISEIFEYITKFYEKYKNDNDLLNYQKVLLFWSNSIYFIKIDDINAYSNSKLEYINIKNIEKNSVFGLSFQFLKDFIYNLNNKSEIFYPLLLLDSGLYYNSNDPTYGFDFQTCDCIKNHLADLLPDVFFVFEKKYLIQEEKGFTYKGFKNIFLNKLVILDNYKGDPIKNDKNIKEVKHFATRTTKFFMHENFGHIKFIYQNKIGPLSPRLFYNKKKELITMVPRNSKKDKNNIINYFMIDQRNEGGESGSFFDYFFGIYEDDLILNLIYVTEDIGKLIDNVKYFTSENLNILKKYIIYKHILSEKGIKFDGKGNTSLEEDINEMKNMIKTKNITITKSKNLKGPNIGEEKKDQYKGILFYNANETRNYSYYVKKIQEAKTNSEANKYLKKLIFNHLKLE